MRSGTFHKKRKIHPPKIGFTLVEILMVTIIITIVIAIVYPIVVKAKETAKISDCLSNMRKIGVGLHLYLDEYDNRFPSAVPWGAPDYWKEQGQVTIQQLLLPYVRNGMVEEKIDGVKGYSRPGVFACPSDTGIPDRYGEILGVSPDRPIWMYTGCSYEYYASDQKEMRRDVPWTGLSPEIFFGSELHRVGAPLSAVADTSKKAFMGDIYFWHVGDRVPDGRVAWRNTLFVDGHADRVRGVYHRDSRLQQLRHWTPPKSDSK